MERVAVPVGRAAAAVSGGPGAVILLQRANTAAKGGQPPAQGPGQWGPAHESMSKRAARYQEQICGQPVSEAYWVGGVGRNSGGVKFDGFKDGVLLEAKGLGYANKFNDDSQPQEVVRPFRGQATPRAGQEAARGGSRGSHPVARGREESRRRHP